MKIQNFFEKKHEGQKNYFVQEKIQHDDENYFYYTVNQIKYSIFFEEAPFKILKTSLKNQI